MTQLMDDEWRNFVIKFYRMGLFSILGKGIQAMINEATTPESFRKGEKFENYVLDYLFIQKHYDMLERTHSYNTNRDFVQSSLKPDFKFLDRWTNKAFYVEVKFRTSLYNNKIVWCTEEQLNRYFEYNRQNPVFLLLGVGNNPKYPEFLSLIPLSRARYTGLFPSYAEKFAINLDEPVTSKSLWAR